ncbi:hypothetical protein EJB05_43459 [Eragrostis curvula]|uniref:BTB domain-containing protein n=1 Tax=Eragrostis curvula TaxID=38414 RepID=A0A5J9TEY3_9POAL|nr:hypothetical protein EJB05_43459 [Eragrostis curvula]
MSASKVKSEGHFVQWEVGRSDLHRGSDAFIMGQWRWHLRTSEISGKTCVELLARPSHSTKDACPVVSFSMKLLSPLPNQTILACHLVTDLPLKMDGGFTWIVDSFVTVRFIIEVKFLDLKVANRSDCDPVSIWPSFALKLQDTCSEIAGMLEEDIPTDITISTSDGSIRAHSSVLAARSPVFQSMFSHNLKERRLSAIDISDMSFNECQAFIN